MTSSLKSVVIGKSEQKINLTSKIVQYGKETDGYILKHGVIEDMHRLYLMVSATLSMVELNQLLIRDSVVILSEHARGDANCCLLIDEDDVQAGHAASVGRVDPDQLCI